MPFSRFSRRSGAFVFFPEFPDCQPIAPVGRDRLTEHLVGFGFKPDDEWAARPLSADEQVMAALAAGELIKRDLRLGDRSSTRSWRVSSRLSKSSLNIRCPSPEIQDFASFLALRPSFQCWTAAGPASRPQSSTALISSPRRLQTFTNASSHLTDRLIYCPSFTTPPKPTGTPAAAAAMVQQPSGTAQGRFSFVAQ